MLSDASEKLLLLNGTLKLAYKDHSRGQVIVVSVDRWPLYGGTLEQLKCTMSQPTVVSIDRWCLYTSGL